MGVGGWVASGMLGINIELAFDWLRVISNRFLVPSHVVFAFARREDAAMDCCDRSSRE